MFLLPGDHAQLYIFEERYKQLIADSTEHDVPFGIAYTNKENEANLGCLVEVAEVLKVYPGGEMDITIRAVALFRLLSFNLQKEGKLYPGGDVDPALEVENTPASAILKNKFKKFLLKDSGYSSVLLTSDNIGIMDVANELNMSDLEKLEFVTCINDKERDQYLINYLRFIELLEVQEQSVHNNIYLN